MVSPASPSAPSAATSRGDAPVAEPRAGSTMHYALLRVTGDTRRRVLGRIALGRALTDTLLDVTDPGVARTKVHWWHEELDRLHAGEPRHPAAVACGDLAGSDVARARLLELLGAAATDRLEPAADIVALDAVLARIGGLRAGLACDALAPEGGYLDDAGRMPDAIGTGLARHERLSRLPPLLARRHAVFSTELYRRHGIEASDLLAGIRLAPAEGEAPTPVHDGGGDGASSAARRALLAEAIGLAEGRLAAGLGDASAAELPAPLRIHAALRLRQLRLWRAKGTDLLRERRSLTPLRKAWTASRIR